MNDQDSARKDGSALGTADPANGAASLPGSPPRLGVVGRTPMRTVRPVTNLAKVFGQFAEVQHQVSEQVLALEESIGQEREALAATVAQLPDLKERINWLISSFYELGQKDVAIEQHIARHDAEIASAATGIGELTGREQVIEQRVERQQCEIAGVAAAVQALAEGQRRWESAMDQVIEVLLRARSAAPPRAKSADDDGAAADPKGATA
jgi:chromosome segregation ATPase